VRTRADGRRAPVEQYPIGACQGTPTDEDVDRFVADVCVRYFTDAAPLSYQLVYDGQHADPEVRARALRRNVELLSFAEYQLGYDLRPYAKRQHERLARDTLYPPELYVPQRYTEIEGYGAPADTPEVHADLLERLKGWLAEPDGHLVVVLGQFGHGKTFLLRELTRRMYTEGNSAVPVLVHLRDLEKSHNLDVLVASQLVQGGERRIDLALFKYLLYEGRIALLFDGFDELAVKVTYEAAKRHLDNILQAIEGRAKVVLVSRSQFFLTDAEVLSALGDRLATVAGRRLVKLVEFNDDQIAEFLRNRLGDEGAVSRLRLLKDVQDLHGLSRNPRMLDFITRIEEKDLLKARDSSGEITNAGLYRELLWEWLHYEQRRKEWPSGLPTLSQLFHAVTVLARRLWDSAAEDLGVSVLDDTADELARLSEDDEGAAPGARPDPDETTHLIGSGTLLVRDSEERFNFIHQSVMEWLVANHVADQIKEGEPVSELIRREMSPLMVDFLCGLLGRDAARYWAKSELAAPGASKWSRENALLVHKHLGEEIAADARLAGTDLSGKDLFKQVLPGTDLTLANLTEVSLVDADLSGANLEGARLVRARLDRSMLAGANLRGADLTGASLLGADVSGADLADATLRGAALLGSNIGADALAALPEAATWGAALPSDELPQLQYRSCAVGMRTVAVGPGLVASGGDDGVLRIWDPVAGAELREWTGHPDEVLSVDFTADGRLLASGGAGGQVRIWDPITGRRVLWLQAHTGRVWSVGFSRDGRRLASAGGDTVVRVWDPATGELEKELAGHEGVVWSVRFSPDGRQLASAGDGQMVRIWDPASGKLMGEWQAHDSAVLGVAFSPAGTLATAGADTVVRTWDPGTGDRIHELTGHTAPVCSVAYSADGRWLASAGDDGVVRIWNAATGVCLRELADHEGEVNSVGFATDGRWLASTGTDLVVRIWDPDTGTLVRRWGGHTDEVNSVGFSSDGRLIAAVGNDRMVRIWNAATGKLERELAGHTGRVWSMGFAPAGRWLATAGADGVVRLWDPATGAPEAELVGHIGRVRSLRFTADGRRLASAGDDGKVRIWDPADGSQTLEWTAHSSRVRALAYTTDGRWLASAGDDGMVRIWNPTAGGLIREWVGAAGAVWSVSFSPDGEILAGGGTDGMVRVWNPATGEELNRWPGQTGAVASVALSPDGRHLMSAGTIGIVRIWDPATGEQQHELVGHTGAVWSTGFSPDGRWVVSGGADSVVRIWEAATGAQRIAMLPLTDGWAALGPSPAAVHRYKLQGSPTGEFWYVQGLCRFEPGELDQYLERRIERIRPDAPLSDD
jgi:WD40 repeat protein/type II secretory pathway predicted ATPase ExeA